jgi:hypothetical protein
MRVGALRFNLVVGSIAHAEGFSTDVGKAGATLATFLTGCKEEVSRRDVWKFSP